MSKSIACLATLMLATGVPPLACALLWVPLAMAQPAPKLSLEKEQKARLGEMEKKARLAALDAKISQLKQEIASLPKSHRDEIAALLRESDEIPNRKTALRKEIAARRNSINNLAAERQALEAAQKEIRALQQRKEMVYVQWKAVFDERDQKSSRIGLAERPGWKSSRYPNLTPASKQELPGLKSDLARLDREQNRLGDEGGRLLRLIEAREKQANDERGKSPEAQAIVREVDRLEDESKKLDQRKTDVNVQIRQLIDADNRVAATRSAKTDELRQKEAERTALVR